MATSLKKQYPSEYNAWSNMKRRTTDPKNRGWKWYGAKGIRVCQEWQNSFTTFLADLGPKPTVDHSLDRIDPTGNYEPANCRWATRQVQITNRRVISKIEIEGRVLTIAEAARHFEIPPSTLRARLYCGMSLEQATEQRARPSTPKTLTWTFNGMERTLSFREWGALLGVAPKTLRNRYRRNLPLDQVLNEQVARTWPTDDRALHLTANVRGVPETHTVREWAQILGRNPETIRYRLKRGLSVDQALTARDLRTEVTSRVLGPAGMVVLVSTPPSLPNVVSLAAKRAARDAVLPMRKAA